MTALPSIRPRATVDARAAAPARDVVLSLDGVHAGYGKAVVVRDVSLSIARREMLCLIGPNGSGKSTLLKSIVGLVDLHAGSILLDGQQVAGRSSDAILRRSIAYVPQTRNVFPTLTVEENIQLGADRKHASHRVAAMCEMFPVLHDKRRARGRELSGGQRQMLACARALASEPRVLLLDEPTAGLSPKAAAEIFAVLGVIKESGVAILIVEQNARAALKVSDHAIVLADGAPRSAATAAEVLAHPEIGEMYLGA